MDKSSNNVTKSQLLDEFSKLLSDFLESNNKLYLTKTEDGFETDIYADYRDEMDDSTIEEILDAEHPMDTFYDKMEEWYFDSRCFVMNDIHAVCKEEETLIAKYEEIQEHFGDDFTQDFEDFLTDSLEELIFVNYPYAHYLNQDVCVDILLDCGDANYDFSCNNILNYYGHGTIDEHSSIAWLCKQQGKQELFEQSIKEYGSFEPSINTREMTDQERIDRLHSCVQKLPRSIEDASGLHGLSYDTLKEFLAKNDGNGIIEKPILVRKNTTLQYTENGAFDIPTFIPSVAMDYFSGNISLEIAKRELIKGNHLIGCESNEEILAELYDSLKGNEKYFKPIQPDTRQWAVAQLIALEGVSQNDHEKGEQLLKKWENLFGLDSILVEECKNKYYVDTVQDKFIKSVVQELENLPSSMGALTFCVSMHLEELINLNDKMKNKEPFVLTIDKSAVCGLYNAWNGGGSILEIELDKDVEVPSNLIFKACEDHSLAYQGIHGVYGTSDGLWKASVSVKDLEIKNLSITGKMEQEYNLYADLYTSFVKNDIDSCKVSFQHIVGFESSEEKAHQFNREFMKDILKFHTKEEVLKTIPEAKDMIAEISKEERKKTQKTDRSFGHSKTTEKDASAKQKEQEEKKKDKESR